MNPPLPGDIDHVFKILLIGDSSVGKSSILLRFVDGIYSDRLNSTIGVDFKAKIVSVEDSNGQMKKVKLTVWDTAGQEKFRTLTSNYYRGAHAVILVYDVSSRVSFENLSGWLEEVDQFIGTRPVVKVLVSNKTDRERVVTRKEASEWAGEHELQLFETSAKAQEGVSDLFEAIVKQMVNNPGVREAALSRNNSMKSSKNITLATVPPERREASQCC